MNKIGDSLTLIKEVNFNKTYITYTAGKNYKIIHINDKGTYYIENDQTEQEMEFYKNNRDAKECQKELIKHSSFWTEQQIENYFINIREQRKQKIKKINCFGDKNENNI